MSGEEPRTLTLTPIGVMRCDHRERADAPRQPRAAEGIGGRIELYPGHRYEDAVADLERWERIWVIFWFDRNEGWRPKVRPPRSATRRGVFATRAPHRPNPLGLSVLRLVGVEGLTLHVQDVDLLDGTPILDIKPYVAWTDAVPEAGGGWLEDDPTGPGRPEDPRGSWEVVFEARAEEQLAWLVARGVALRDRVAEALALGPQPHAYRRIKVLGDRRRLAVKEWRAWFTIDGKTLRVTHLTSGYRDPAASPAPHPEFAARFPG